MEAHGLNSDTITKDINSILKGKAFNRFTMTSYIRLVSQYKWSQGAINKNVKIKRCIVIQSQFQAELNSEKVLDLEVVDKKLNG